MFVQQVKEVIREIDSRKIDDLMMAKRSLLGLSDEYQGSMLDTPEWIIDGISSLLREIVNRSRAELERELKKAEAQYEALSSREERRVSAAARVEALKKKLDG